MGNKDAKGAKGAKGNVQVKLASKDVKFLQSHTGMSEGEINQIFSDFMANNPDGQLNQTEFIALYDKLRAEPYDRLDEISKYVFKAFDKDHNGSISFNEFMIAYALTSKGDLQKKLDFTFSLYDIDNNGTLTKDELKAVVIGMLDLLGANQRNVDVNGLANNVANQLDTNHDGKIGKDEFIKGLMEDYSLRSLLSPFN